MSVETTFFRVLVWTGARVEELGARHDRDEALRLLRSATQPAALAQGNKILQCTPRGKSHEKAFVRFAEGGADAKQSSKPASRALPAQTPAEPMPEREPVAPVVEPVVPIVAKGCDEAEPATRVDAREAKHESIELCANCHNEPRAHVTRRTKLGTETWGSKCRKAAPPSKPTKKLSKKPASSAPNTPKISDGSTSKRSTPKRSTPSLEDALAIVERDAALIARLGGYASASELADIVEAHGGPAALTAALRRVLSVAQGRA